MALPLPGNLICELKRSAGLTATSIDAATGVSRISKWADQSGNGNDWNSRLYPFREPNRPGVGFEYDPATTPKNNMTMTPAAPPSARGCTLAFCFSLSAVQPYSPTGGNVNYLLFTDSGGNLNVYLQGTTNGQIVIYNGTSVLSTGLYPVSGRNVLVIVSSASSITAYLNDLPSFTTANPATNTNLATLAIGGTATSPNVSGYFDALAIYNTAVGVATVDQIKAEFDSLYLVSSDRSRLLVCDGDSITAGYGCGLLRGWPNMLEGLNYRWVNTAVCGARVSGGTYDLTAKLAARITTPFLGTAQSYDRKVVIVWAGTNDNTLGGVAGATIATNLRTLIANYRSAGFDFVIAATMLPRQSSSTVETERGNFNASIRTDLAGADVLIDFDLDARLGAAGAQTNTTYYLSDQIHLTDVGQQIVADKFRKAVAWAMEQPLDVDRLGRFPASALDDILIESGITASANLVNDAGTQLTKVNARQALAIACAALGGKLTGINSNAPVFKQVGVPSGSTRISATTDSTGRPTITVTVPN